MEFGLVTLNTWKCDGNYIHRLPLLSSGLLEICPDLIACQEVFHSTDNTISTKTFLEKKLKMKAYFFPSRQKDRFVSGSLNHSYSGLCFFTNEEIIQYKEIMLPTSCKDGDRTAQLALIKHEGYKICIVNTHLTHLKNETDLRVRQLQTILSNTNEITFDMFILCGDLNDINTSTTIKYLEQDMQNFQSVFKRNVPTHKSGKQIDYIFYKSNVSVKVLEKKIILNKPINHVDPSDHFGLYASFNLM